MRMHRNSFSDPNLTNNNKGLTHSIAFNVESVKHLVHIQTHKSTNLLIDF